MILCTMMILSHYQIWSGRSEAQDLAMKGLLNEINLSIYAWINISQHGQQLSSSRRIIRLFDLMRDLGMSLEIQLAGMLLGR